MNKIIKALEISRREGVNRLLQRSVEFTFLRSIVSTKLMRKLYLDISPEVYRIFVQREYQLPINPLRVNWVKPDLITRVSGRPWPPRHRYPDIAQELGSVQGGNWDRNWKSETKPGYTGTPPCIYRASVFEETILHQSLQERFVGSEDWLNTRVGRCALRLAESSSPYLWRGCESKEDIVARGEEIDELYKSIRDHGYKTQKQLIIEGESKGGPTLLETLSREIVVDIGRNGDLLLAEGHHRLSIAKILELDKVPVVIAVRHEKWVDELESRYHNDEFYAHDRHPDILQIKNTRSN